jgi:hypothetical protein
MVIFIKRIAFFLLPVVAITLTPLLLFLLSEEALAIFNEDKLIDHNYLIGYAYNDANYRFIKYKVLTTSNYEVIALGSSRVLQFRKEMFSKNFYNAGYSITNISQFRQFMELLPKQNFPRFLIIGLDQWMFNTDWDRTDRKREVKNWKESFVIMPSVRDGLSLYKDLFSGKIELDKIFLKEKYVIGLSALCNESGLRSDGSYYYGDQIARLNRRDTSSIDFGFKDTFQRIELGVNRFQHGTIANPIAFEELFAFLKWCKEHNIKVIGIMMPYADAVYKKMIESGNYSYISNLEERIRGIFSAYQFEYHHFNSVSDFGSSDYEVIDGFHAGEKAYLKMIIEILKEDSCLNDVCDVNKLVNDLENCTDRFTVYNYNVAGIRVD